MPDEEPIEEELVPDEEIDLEEVTLYGDVPQDLHHNGCVCDVCLATP